MEAYTSVSISLSNSYLYTNPKPKINRNRIVLALKKTNRVAAPELYVPWMHLNDRIILSWFPRQWLPRQKLSLLGQNNRVDNTKLYEGKKPSLRKSVQQAFARALSYKQQISSQQDDEETLGYMEANEENDDKEDDMEDEFWDNLYILN